jgi:ketosteroid isomerase-like protein
MSAADQAARLQLMLDKHELRELGETYCRGIDRQDFALVRTLYHDDAIDDHGDMFKGNPDDYVAWLPTIMKMWDATVHSISNAVYAVDGDKANGELYVVAYHRTHAPDAKEIVVGGRYLDRYEKRDGRWKFSHRSLAMDWCNVRDVNQADYDTFAAGAVRGRHDAGDPSYAELPLMGRVRK